MTNGRLSELEKRVIRAQELGQKWAELHEVWLQLDRDEKNYLAALMNDLSKANIGGLRDASETKLERLARGSDEFRKYILRICIAKGEELRAKVRYDNARDFFEAARSLEATERAKIGMF